MGRIRWFRDLWSGAHETPRGGAVAVFDRDMFEHALAAAGKVLKEQWAKRTIPDPVALDERQMDFWPGSPSLRAEKSLARELLVQSDPFDAQFGLSPNVRVFSSGRGLMISQIGTGSMAGLVWSDRDADRWALAGGPSDAPQGEDRLARSGQPHRD
jgi:hypothetical protein